MMRMDIKDLCTTLLFLLLAAFAADAQESTPFVLGQTQNIYSKQLNEQRKLNIYLPPEYAQDTAARYPVIYLLDGSADEDFIHIAGLAQFFHMLGLMPGVIVAGIANTDRKHDFTCPSTKPADRKLVPTSGGSAAFIRFIETELLPFMESHYRTGSHRTLIGQSLGGLLATEILWRQPALFNHYLIISPSLWWDDELLLKMSPAPLPDSSVQVYVSVGSEGKQMEGDARRLASLLRQRKQRVRFAPLPKETHLTILHQSVYNAFRAGIY